MKDNSYMNAMNSIKAPRAVIDNAVQSVNETEDVIEVTAIRKKKHRVLKFTSAVAAVLALIIGLSFIPLGGKDKTDAEHNFVITAGAAEITPDTYITLGNLEESNETGLYRYLDEGLKKVSVLELGREYNVDIQCSGEHIESITYTMHNGYLRFDPDFNGLIDFTEVAKDVTDNYVVSYPDWASSCTYDYNNQPRSFWDAEEMGFEIPEDGFDGTVPLRMCVRFKFEEGEIVRTFDEEDYVNLDDVVYSEFNAHADDYSLDVTANFTDGTQVTKTLKFICDDSMSQLQLLVTEVIE